MYAISLLTIFRIKRLGVIKLLFFIILSIYLGSSAYYYAYSFVFFQIKNNNAINLKLLIDTLLFPFYLSGLSFLINPGMGPDSIFSLFIKRIPFFDSILLPLSYTFTMLKKSIHEKINQKDVLFILVVAFYYGFSLPSKFYSFRQTLHLLPIMGLLLVNNYLNKSTNSKT